MFLLYYEPSLSGSNTTQHIPADISPPWEIKTKASPSPLPGGSFYSDLFSASILPLNSARASSSAFPEDSPSRLPSTQVLEFLLSVPLGDETDGKPRRSHIKFIIAGPNTCESISNRPGSRGHHDSS